MFQRCLARGCWILAGLSGAVFALAVAACGDDASTGTNVPQAGDGGQSMPSDGGDGDADGGTDGGDPDGQAPGNEKVLVGIEANAAADASGQSSSGNKLAAQIEAIAAGVRMVVLRQVWRDMSEATLAEMASDASFYGSFGVSIFVNLAFVDRIKDERPDTLTGAAWDSPLMLDGLKAAIDSVFGKLGKTVSALSLGNEVDVFLEAHPGDRAAIQKLLEQAGAYARSHPKAADDLRVGVSLSPKAVVADGAPYKDLLSAGDVAVLSYRPGLGQSELAQPAPVAADLDAMIVAVGGMPIWLDPVSYPSADMLASSSEKQGLFYESLFGALAPRRKDISWVNIVSMHDPAPGACKVYAEKQGQAADGPFAAYVCSWGLALSAGSKKSSWQQVLSGTAAFAQP